MSLEKENEELFDDWIEEDRAISAVTTRAVGAWNG